ncbi:helicase-exonuclease AddAB subunit AddB [Paenibacillus thermoaerophilus]|uniref:ATP-dependent helicase/deoxyribonuclease subunit B n=1 Tax=Paenibacillus thermoaerophilus TaxID=1215385 RepID=A0ABW2UXJ2_9BACL|nr:helicase-exonuclease AddAB subunit AddB [Paenibacillus thermoaerophilus]TMV19005.1 helicase-exonuclease AddAB subunit AddB [Paenibacillus thermoaerophilus]
MSLRLVIGRAGSGKTELCLRELEERLAAEPEGHPLLLLVPEQGTFQAEHALVSSERLGGMVRAQALSFRRLAWRVMQETGGSARVPVDDTGKQMLIYQLLEEMREQLSALRRSSGQTGYLAKLAELFTEFRRYGVPAETLERRAEAAGLASGATGELLQVYAAYERRMFGVFSDGEDDLNRLALQAHASAYIKDSEIWIDGFNGFTPQELAVVGQLMRHARRVTLTVCADRDLAPGETPDELELFHPTLRTLAKVKAMARELGVETEETVMLEAPGKRRFRESPMLAELERRYEHRHRGGWTPVLPGRGGVTLLNAPNRAAEVEAVARRILELVRDEGYRYRDIAIMVRNFAGYADLLRLRLESFGIPFFLDHKREVSDHPLAEFVRSALDVAVKGWSYDHVFRCVKTDFLLPVPPDGEADSPEVWRVRLGFFKLENFVLETGISGWRWTDGKPWRLFRARTEDGSAGSGESDELTAEERELNDCRRMIAAPLAKLERGLAAARTAREMAECLYRLLDETEAAKKLEAWANACIREGRPQSAREHEGVWNGLLDLLDQLVELLGDEPIAPDRFAGLVASGLDGMKLGLVPPSIDQVLVGSLERTRSAGIRACFILGANDGVLPAKPREDSLLGERERELLAREGVELAEDSRRRLLDEPFLIYSALTLPSERLYVSWPSADEEGKGLLPSETVRHLKRILPNVKEVFVPAGDEPLLTDEARLEWFANPDETLARLFAELGKWRDGSALPGVWKEAYNWFVSRPQWRERLDRLLDGLFYVNEESNLDENLTREMYGTVIRASVSRLERFAACPFAHFASYGLGLRERRLYKLEAPDVGVLFHGALSEMLRKLTEDGLSWADLSPEECAALAEEAVDRLVPGLQHEILLSSSRHRYLTGRLRRVVGEAASTLAKQGRRGSFAPAGAEIPFGPGSPLPPLTFRLDNGCVIELAGRIDRIDTATDGKGGLWLRVLDYKSGRTELNLAEVYYGLSLQMLAYLEAAVSQAEKWLGRPAEPAGVLYFHVHNPWVRDGAGLAPEELEAERFKRFKMRGLLLADPDLVRMMDGNLQSGHSDMLPVALKSDGGFYSSSSVADAPRWKALRHHARRVIRGLGRRMTDGDVSIRPYRMGRETACAYCEYKAVCRFDPLTDADAYRELRPLAKDEIWSAIESAAGLTETADREEDEPNERN